jgi:hypothetical protein
MGPQMLRNALLALFFRRRLQGVGKRIGREGGVGERILWRKRVLEKVKGSFGGV